MVQLRGFLDDDGEERSVLYACDLVPMDNAFLRAALSMYYTWRRFKVLPHGGGTLDERQTTLDILAILDAEAIRFDDWEREQDRAAARRAHRS